MTKRLLILLIIFCSLRTLAQFPNDSIIFIYFHPIGDTIIKIDKEYSHIDRTYLFNLNKVYYDTNGVNPFYNKIIKSKNLVDIKPLLDSISKLNYVLGINKSNKCVNSIKISDIKKLKSDKYGYIAEYTIQDIRVLDGDTIENSKHKKNKFNINHKDNRDELMKKTYEQISFVWSSVDHRMTYFLFQSIITTTDEEGNEIQTSLYKADMKKLKK